MLQSGQITGGISTDLDNYGFDEWNPVAFAVCDLAAYDSGTRFNTLAKSYSAKRDGYRLENHGDDFYNRIHLIPRSLELGNLVGDQQRTLTVWNAFLTSQPLTDFELVNGEGINVTAPVTVPHSIRPLRMLDYVLDITSSGPPIIDATATWTINGGIYEIPITGRRIVLFAFPPNWSSPVEETLEHLTVLDTSYTGKEQITEIRKEPRRLLQYNFRIHARASNVFDNMMFGWTARLFCVPLWQEKTKLANAISAGATSLDIDTTARTFQTGSLAVIFAAFDSYEIVEIASATSSSVTLARGTDNAWPAGTRVYPAALAASDPEVATSRQSDTHIDGLIRFTVDPADSFPRMDQVAAPQTYRSYELYTKTTNWIAPLNTSISSRQTFIDNGDGIFRIVRRAPFPLIQRGFRWLLRTRQDAELLRQFFARRRGRLKPVWIASGMRDFVLKKDATAVATIIEVENNQYADFVKMQAARRDIVIQLRNGTYIARRITGYAVNGENLIELTLDAAIGVDLTPSAVKKISYLGFYRLSSDSYTFTWHTNAVASVETNFVLKESP